MHPKQIKLSFFARLSSAFLICSLALPSGSYALRNQGPSSDFVRGGLEEALDSQHAAGLEERKPLGKEDAFRQLQDLKIAFGQGNISSGGFQDGRVVNLRTVPENMEILFYGDPHTDLTKLKRFLAYQKDGGKSNEDKLRDREAILVITGDLVHDPAAIEKNDFDMTSSIAMTQFVMQLKIDYPRQTYVHLGNHDLLYDTSGLPIENENNLCVIYRKSLQGLYGEKYVEQYNNIFVRGTHYMVIGNGFFSFHGGPPFGIEGGEEEIIERVKRLDFSHIGTDDDARDILRWLLLTRPGSDPVKLRYTWASLQQFLKAMGQPRAVVILGHTHPPPGDWYRYPFKETHQCVALYGGPQALSIGYESFQNGKLTLVPIPDSSGRGRPRSSAGVEEVRVEARFEAHPFMDYNQLTLIQRDVIRQLQGLKRSPLFDRSSDFSLDVGLTDESIISSLFIRGKKGLFGGSSLSLTEVIRNSVDAIAELAQRLNKKIEGVITARVRRTGNLWIIEITDNGVGIPSAVLQEIANHRPVTTKEGQQQGSLGGSGTALWGGVVGSSLMETYEGIIQIDTLASGMKKAVLLADNRDQRAYGSSFSEGQRTERGTTLRLIFKNSAIFKSKTGLEESLHQTTHSSKARSGLEESRWGRLQVGLEQAPGGVRKIGRTSLVDLRQSKLLMGIRILDWVGIPTEAVPRGENIEQIRLSRMSEAERQELLAQAREGDVLFIDEMQEMEQIPLNARKKLTIIRVSAWEVETLTQQKVEALIRAAERAVGRSLHVRDVTMRGLSESGRYSLAVITGT